MKEQTFQEYYEEHSPKGREERIKKLKLEVKKLELKHKISKLKHKKESPYAFGRKSSTHAKKRKFEDYITPNYKVKEIKRREVIRKKASKNFDDFLVNM
jgi:hypothetical protein